MKNKQNKNKMLSSSGFVDKYSHFLDQKEKEAENEGFIYNPAVTLEDAISSTQAYINAREQKNRAERYKRKFEEMEQTVHEIKENVKSIKMEHKKKIKELENTIKEKDQQLERACKLLQFTNKKITNENHDYDTEDDDVSSSDEEEEEEVPSKSLKSLILQYLKSKPGKKYTASELRKIFSTYAPEHGFHGKLSTMTVRLYELTKADKLDREEFANHSNKRAKYRYFIPEG